MPGAMSQRITMKQNSAQKLGVIQLSVPVYLIKQSSKWSNINHLNYHSRQEYPNPGTASCTQSSVYSLFLITWENYCTISMSLSMFLSCISSAYPGQIIMWVWVSLQPPTSPSVQSSATRDIIRYFTSFLSMDKSSNYILMLRDVSLCILCKSFLALLSAGGGWLSAAWTKRIRRWARTPISMSGNFSSLFTFSQEGVVPGSKVRKVLWFLSNTTFRDPPYHHTCGKTKRVFSNNPGPHQHQQKYFSTLISQNPSKVISEVSEP